jgi:hypothetical protein
MDAERKERKGRKHDTPKKIRCGVKWQEMFKQDEDEWRSI